MAKPARNPEQAELAFPKTGTKKAGRTPEELARAAIARMPTTVSGGCVKDDGHAVPDPCGAEYLSACAIREQRNTPALIAEILTAEAKRKSASRPATC